MSSRYPFISLRASFQRHNILALSLLINSDNHLTSAISTLLVGSRNSFTFDLRVIPDTIITALRLCNSLYLSE